MKRTHTTKSARRYPRRITDQRRRELAQKWLEVLELTVTEERVPELAPWVLHFHPAGPRGQIANQLVREGKVPTAWTINEAYADQLGRKPFWPKELAAEADLAGLTSAETKQLLKFVAKVRRHKHGLLGTRSPSTSAGATLTPPSSSAISDEPSSSHTAGQKEPCESTGGKRRPHPPRCPRQSGTRPRTHPRPDNGADSATPSLTTVRTHETVTTIVGAGGSQLARDRLEDL